MSLEEKVKEAFREKADQDAVIQWSQGKSNKSKPLYLRELKKFCKYAGKAPRQLIEDRMSEYKQIEGESLMDFAQRKKESERLFQRVFQQIEDEERFAPKTIATSRLIVKSFYSYWGYPLCKEDTKFRKAKQRKFHDVELSESDYKAIVDAGDMKEKLRIVWLAQTGMRLGDVQNFKVKDLKEFDLGKLDALKVPMAIDYLPEKTEGREIGWRFTFLGEYGVELLKAELRGRVEEGGIEVVREQYIFTGQGGNELSDQQWNSMVKDLAKKAGLRLNGEHGRIRVYCFRKYFDSQLQGHNTNKNIVYWMMGHVLEGMEETYFQGQVQKDNLRQIYANVENYLTPLIEKIVEKAVIPSEVTEQMASMFKTITTLKTDLEEQKKDYVDLRADFEKLVRTINEEGQKRIFKGTREMTPEEREKLKLPRSTKRSE